MNISLRTTSPKVELCLVKCYLGYYRFSIDLDFTFPRVEKLSRAKRRKLITEEVKSLARLLEEISRELGLVFKPWIGNNINPEFVHFEGNENRKIVFFNLKTDRGEDIKVEVIFFEKLFFEPKEAVAKTLLDRVDLSREEKAFYEMELKEYVPVRVFAYAPEEILVEKVRAILTRKFQKARDFYDVFMLLKESYDYKDFKQEIIEKVKFTMKYNPNVVRAIEGNLKEFGNLTSNIALSEELRLFVMNLDKQFLDFLGEFEIFLENLTRKILDEKR